jgi:hypothetical protein
MTSKIQAAQEVQVYCSELGRHAYDVHRADRTAHGMLVPKQKSPRQYPEGVVDAVAAFEAWMGVLSRYRDWRHARDPARILQLRALREPISAEVVQACRIDARPLLRRTKALDAALVEAAEEHGDLGVGQDVETIATKLADLQNFVLFGREMEELAARGRPNEPLPEYITNALEQDGRTVREGAKGLSKVHSTIEATSHKYRGGQLMVHASNMYAAITVGSALVAVHPRRHMQLCAGCLTLFVAKHPRAETCSPRCRQRKRA